MRQPEPGDRRRAPQQRPGRRVWLDVLTLDARHAVRGLERAPAFASLSVALLAIGLGSTTALFAAVDAVLLSPLPYAQSERLVALAETDPTGRPGPVSLLTLADWEAVPAVTAVGGYRLRSFALTHAGSAAAAPEVVQAGLVTSGFLDVLGVAPVDGRFFDRAEERAGLDVVVISRSLRDRFFGVDAVAVGGNLALNDVTHVVIGVVPADFEFPIGGRIPDLYVPIDHGDYGSSRSVRALRAIGRMAPGQTYESVAAAMAAVATRLAAEHPDAMAGRGVRVESLHRSLRGENRDALRLLSGAAALLTLITVANVAGLMVGRVLARRDEIAVRTSLGASAPRLARLFLLETGLIAALGAAVGLAVAAMVLALLPAVLPVLGGVGRLGVTAAEMPAIHGRTAAVTMIASGAVTVLLACVGTVTARASGLQRPGGAQAPTPRTRARDLLVAGQIGISMVLLLGLGLLARSFVNLMAVDPGFATSSVVRFGIGLPEARYDHERALIDFHRRLEAELQRLPDVVAAGVVASLPLGGAEYAARFRFPDGDDPDPPPSTSINVASPGWFASMEIPILSGRGFGLADGPEGARVALVNDAFRRRFGGPAGLVGRRLELSWRSELNPPGTVWEVVGVAGDVRHRALDLPAEPTVYLPATQFGLEGGTYTLATPAPGEELTRRVAAVVSAIDPDLQRIALATIDDRIDSSLAERRAALAVAGALAALATLLTAIGVYGLVATTTARRRREMGVRRALGARRRNVVALVAAQALGLAFRGSVLGMLFFLPVSRLLADRLYGVGAADPLTAAGAFVMLLLASVAACVVPSARVVRDTPIMAIREP